MSTTTVAALSLILCIIIALNVTSYNSRKRKEALEKQKHNEEIDKKINDIFLELKKTIKDGDMSNLIDAAIKLGEAKMKQKHE